MKVKELIKELQKLDGNLKVKIVDDNDYDLVIWSISENGEIWVGNE